MLIHSLLRDDRTEILFSNVREVILVDSTRVFVYKLTARRGNYTFEFGIEKTIINPNELVPYELSNYSELELRWVWFYHFNNKVSISHSELIQINNSLFARDSKLKSFSKPYSEQVLINYLQGEDMVDEKQFFGFLNKINLKPIFLDSSLVEV